MLELGLALDPAGHRVTVVSHDLERLAEPAVGLSRLDIRAVREGPLRLPASRAAWLRRQWLGMPAVRAHRR